MNSHRTWNVDALLELGRSYQPAAVFAAAADLELFDALAKQSRSAKQLVPKLRCDPRGLEILLDALASLGLLRKKGDSYALPAGTAKFLSSDGAQSIIAMAQHQANCLRNWAQLAKVVKSGRIADKSPSVRGPVKDAAAFIGAMHNVSAPQAAKVIRGLRPFRFKHLLDVGGASGTWTIALLRARPSAEATLFDLPHVLPMAQRRLAAAGLSRRVRLAGGNFSFDPLPPGADLAWVSAIVHQNSRDQNRALFVKIRDALVPGGIIAIRDILMEPSRTQPAAGALFAINMLVATPGGGTFTFEELQEDLEFAGFTEATVRQRDLGMHSIVVATKPGPV